MAPDVRTLDDAEFVTASTWANNFDGDYRRADGTDDAQEECTSCSDHRGIAPTDAAAQSALRCGITQMNAELAGM